MESIILGGGCFWCTEAIYTQIHGVEIVTPGYSGGNTKNPTYALVCEGDTGHAEVIKIDFNPSLISLETLLDVFWDIHDPTSLNKQGEDIGSQYRSIILYQGEKQLETVKQSIIKAKTSLPSDKAIVTEIKPLVAFYPAEDSHKNYFSKNSSLPYCNLVISPKLKQFKEKYHHLLKSEN